MFHIINNNRDCLLMIFLVYRLRLQLWHKTISKTVFMTNFLEIFQIKDLKPIIGQDNFYNRIWVKDCKNIQVTTSAVLQSRSSHVTCCFNLRWIFAWIRLKLFPLKQKYFSLSDQKVSSFNNKSITCSCWIQSRFIRMTTIKAIAGHFSHLLTREKHTHPLPPDASQVLTQKWVRFSTNELWPWPLIPDSRIYKD